MKKLISIFLIVIMVITFTACAVDTTFVEETAVEEIPFEYKVGVILLHNEDIGYDFAHMQGIQKACEELGIPEENVLWKYNISEDESCYDAAVDLAEAGCNVIISDSYGHQTYMTLAAEEYPEVEFLIATGDTAAVDGLDNTHNFFNHTYESRYVSGVVAGLKLEEMIEEGVLTQANYNEDGTIKIGYVGAFPYAEVVSGYTAFYLGVRSIVDNVSMDVQYISSWADAANEQQAAEYLLSEGCCIISQHADSTGGPSAIEAAVANGSVCYYVGYNIDMRAVAPTVILTSAQNDWSVYYNYALNMMMNGCAKDIAVDWCEGYSEGANMIAPLGDSCAPGTDIKIAELEKAIADGTFNVFDTNAFTVNGESLDSYIFNTSTMNSDYTAVQYEGQDYECIENGVFNESVIRSAPYFGIIVDGINELN